jgi:hypothetical protein
MISVYPFCGALLLVSFDIFEFENWLVDKKYIFLTHFIVCLHSFHVPLKYKLFYSNIFVMSFSSRLTFVQLLRNLFLEPNSDTN